ncbi:acyltransferase family protein [Parasediminibacterium sp. JCM 36343]|uniref:acyltransferase family protein n=1 Tax=Parasediminibacterium sp. JCM 36343 TaxID=3374279 RepID=UPI00397E4516
MIQKSSSRNYFLDISRGIAASTVAFFHFGQMRNQHDFYGNLINYGWLGVPVFFIISGYSISSSIDNTTSIKQFWLKRLFRIYPAYWLSVALVFLIVILQKILTGHNTIVILPIKPIDLVNTFVSFYAPISHTPMINWVYWTLVYELFFYLVFSIVLFIPKQYRLWYFSGIILISIVYVFIKDISVLFFLKLIGYFGLGVCLDEIRKKGWGFNIYIGATLAMASIILNRKYCIGSESDMNSMIAFYVGIAFAIAVYFASPYFKTKPLFAKLGDISYSLYLFHIPVGNYFLRSIFLSFFPTAYHSIPPFILDIFYFIVCVLFSHLVYKTVELPAMGLLKKKKL